MSRHHNILAALLSIAVFSIGTRSATAQQRGAAPVASEDMWLAVEQPLLDAAAGEAWIRPEVFRAFVLDLGQLEQVLAAAPLETAVWVTQSQTEIALPMPDGEFARFRFVEAPVMEPDLAAKFPEIRTYLGQGIDDPTASVRFDWTPAGFHAQILAPTGAVYIDPYNRGDNTLHVSYYKRDYWALTRDFTCELFVRPGPPQGRNGSGFAALTGETLRTYRLACAATGEYTAFHGGSVAAGMAAIATTVNRVTGIYETELAIRMVLVGNNDLLVYTNSGSDPYTNDDGGAMLGQNQSTIDSVIGSGNYDIGHVFSTGGGGVAYLGVVCYSGWKAQGVTGRGAPVGDAFDVDYVAHEMGHQFGGNHTFNGSNGSCAGGNRNGSTAYEPGSGATIMAYAGICGADDLQAHSDPYFHSESFDEIRAYVTGGSGGSCPTTSGTGNSDPTVSAGINHTIPASTPFTLTASGSDPDGDTPTYCWEERDLGPAQALSSGDNGSSPLFRSWPATTSPARTYPRLSDLINNTTAPGERLPTTNRAMTFRVTARDEQAGGGGSSFDDMQVTVNNGAGPFLVTSPNSGAEVWSGVATVTWNVAGTSGAPVNASNVDILLSTDGGLTYPITLASNTPNDGSESIVVPNAPTTTARVRVQGSGNIFFDISNNDFTIDLPGALGITLPSGAPTVIPPETPTSFDVQIVELGENLVPGSPTLHYRYNGGTYLTAALSPLGGDLYQATLPLAGCSDMPEFYVSAQGDLGTFVNSPGNAPTTVYSAIVGTAMTLMDDDFETDQGWVATNLGATSGDWVRGVPVNDPSWTYDPISDSDGSGNCLLTQNQTGNTDVDNGSVRVTSPTIDMSGGGVTISYDYYLYLTDADGNDRLLVEINNSGGAGAWTEVARHDTDGGTSWRSHVISQTDLDTAGVTLTGNMQIRFTANDGGTQSIVESGVDAFLVTGFSCAQNEYTLSISTVGNGVVTVNPDKPTYTIGEIVTLTAVADPGWTFASWSGDLSGSVNPDQVTIAGNTSVTATFTQGQYTLTINTVGNGVVNSVPNQATYTYGQTVDLTAVPDAGWTFDSWSGDLTGGANPDSITITGNTNVTATFTQDQYTLTTLVSGNGSVSRVPDEPTYSYGQTVTLSANADSGWEFQEWQGDLTGGVNPEMITMDGGKSVTAVFTPIDCPGDLDGNLSIDLTDLAILLSDFDCAGGCVGDVDGDGDTDLTDLALLLANFDVICD